MLGTAHDRGLSSPGKVRQHSGSSSIATMIDIHNFVQAHTSKSKHVRRAYTCKARGVR